MMLLCSLRSLLDAYDVGHSTRVNEETRSALQRRKPRGDYPCGHRERASVSLEDPSGDVRHRTIRHAVGGTNLLGRRCQASAPQGPFKDPPRTPCKNLANCSKR